MEESGLFSIYIDRWFPGENLIYMSIRIKTYSYMYLQLQNPDNKDGNATKYSLIFANLVNHSGSCSDTLHTIQADDSWAFSPAIRPRTLPHTLHTVVAFTAAFARAI